MSDPKKHSIDDFLKKPEKQEFTEDGEIIENDWTQEEVIAVGLKIMKELGILDENEEL